jgi:transcriptional regulator with XRE-family HTH domain
MNELGQRLRELREHRGLTVKEFAERIKKTPGYVSRIEARGEIPRAELLCEIASVYRVSPKELLDLAKQNYLERAERELEARNSSALALYRRKRK